MSTRNARRSSRPAKKDCAAQLRTRNLKSLRRIKKQFHLIFAVGTQTLTPYRIRSATYNTSPSRSGFVSLDAPRVTKAQYDESTASRAHRKSRRLTPEWWTRKLPSPSRPASSTPEKAARPGLEMRAEGDRERMRAGEGLRTARKLAVGDISGDAVGEGARSVAVPGYPALRTVASTSHAGVGEGARTRVTAGTEDSIGIADPTIGEAGGDGR